MSIAQSLLPEYDNEMAATRKILERVPLQHAAWKPHPKSMTLGYLAAHVATLPGQGARALGSTEFDMAPPGGAPFRMPEFDSTPAMLDAFDERVRTTRAAIANASDADLRETWSLKRAGQTILSMPRIAVLRSFMMNHLIHHRAQLGVYLRMHDVPVPGMYGPSADEK